MYHRSSLIFGRIYQKNEPYFGHNGFVYISVVFIPGSLNSALFYFYTLENYDN